MTLPHPGVPRLCLLHTKTVTEGKARQVLSAGDTAAAAAVAAAEAVAMRAAAEATGAIAWDPRPYTPVV